MPPAEPMTQEIINRLKPYAVFDYYNTVDGVPGQQNFMVSTLSIPQHPVALCGPSREFADALCSLLNGSTLTNLTPSGVERIRAEAFEEAAKAARGWVIWLLKGHEGRERIAESVAKRILSKGQALALPSEPPSQGDVEGRARELLRELLLAIAARPDVTRLFGPHEQGIYERARQVTNGKEDGRS